jgi:hypothetical protein
MFGWFGRTLTFELVADAGEGKDIGALLADASNGAILCDDERTVGGYAAHGEDIDSAIAPLVEAFAVELHDAGDALRSPSNGPLSLPPLEELGASPEPAGAAIIEREQAPAASLPAALTMAYYDAARDYQTGQVRASAPGPSRTVRTLTLPGVLDAGSAKATAESLLLRAWALRERITIRLPPRYLDTRPGALFRLPGVAGDWVAEAAEIERFVLTVSLRPWWAHAGSRSADPGRSLPQPDVVAAPTRIALFDLPDPETSQPTLALAAASPSGAWKPVPIEVDGAGTVSAGRTALGEAVLGEALTVLADGQADLLDLVHHIDVELANPDHWLQSRDDAALAMGANLAMVGDEMIQFGQAEVLAPGTFRLSKLLRGRRGSDWAMAGHGMGENFVLLNPATLKAIAVPIEGLGSTVTVTARGPGDTDSPAPASRSANGEAMRPLSPAHLEASRTAGGELLVRWLQRSRLAWAFSDEVGAPPDPAVLGYRLRIAGSAATIERDCSEPQATLTAAEVASLGAGSIEIQLRQIGTLALSRPQIITINA